jgi:D-lyxose ketol-isomerase
MKRSELNNYLQEAKAFFAKHQFELPPWAFWSPAQWRKKGPECAEIKRNKLGWDITDFGSGDFKKIGLLLFTVRNGCYGVQGGKPYAEKIMISRANQVTPAHFHWNKMEDIINRGGGDLVMRLWKADKKEGLSKAGFTVQVDGVTRRMKAGGLVRLKPGESITLEPYIYHRFWAERSMCLIGEVSMVNDDANDNRFYDKVGRFPEIEEDARPLHLLCNEYPG